MRLSRGSSRVRSRRFLIVTRPKVRSRRMIEWGASAAVVVLALAAVAVLRNLPRERRRWSVPAARIPVPRAMRLETVRVEGVPPLLESRLETAIGSASPAQWGFFEPYRVARRLQAEFPCLQDVWFSRNWLARTATFHAALQRPVARVNQGGERLWLSDAGKIYDSPEGVYPESGLPLVELGRGADRENLALAQFLTVTAKDGAVPSRVERMEYRSADEGWQARLEDGTVLLWGSLSWTEEKLARLNQVLADAGKRFNAGVMVDLRYFEDGKILVRPASGGPLRPAAVAGRPPVRAKL